MLPKSICDKCFHLNKHYFCEKWLTHPTFRYDCDDFVRIKKSDLIKELGKRDSKSYKYPVTLGKTATVKIDKRQANRKVRYAKSVPNGKAYVKLYPQWDICDWKHYFEKGDDGYDKAIRK